MYRLREIQRKDIPIINEWRNDEEIISSLGAPFRFINQEVDEQWFDSYMKQRTTSIRCAITKVQDDKIIGLISLVGINYINRSAELHLLIGKEGQGEGAGTYAVETIVNHGFNDYGLHRIELTVLADNMRARHVYEKCGFVQEGIKQQAVFKNSMYKDMVMYSIISNKDNCIGGG